MSNATTNSSSFFRLAKTSKPIESIKDKVTDRLIITRSGEMYFDYSSDLRLKLAGGSGVTSGPSGIQSYLCSLNFSSLGQLHDEIIVRYEQLSHVSDKDSVLDVIDNSLVFDSTGNYAIVIETFNELKKCKCKIIGLLSSSIKNDIFENINNKILGNFIVVKEEENVAINFDSLNTKTNEISKESIKLSSSDKSLNLNVNNNIIDLGLKLSKADGNIATLVEDGLLISSYTKEDIDTKFKELKFTNFSGPFSSIDEIITPMSNTIYIVGDSDPYDFYIFINNESLYLGKFNDSDEYYTKEEVHEVISVIRI